MGAPRRAGPTDALTPRAGATAETVKADMFACFEVMQRVDSLCCDVRDDATRATLRDPALRTETGDDAGPEVLIFRNRRLRYGSRYHTARDWPKISPTCFAQGLTVKLLAL